jgi:hypothetical protein
MARTFATMRAAGDAGAGGASDVPDGSGSGASRDADEDRAMAKALARIR